MFTSQPCRGAALLFCTLSCAGLARAQSPGVYVLDTLVKVKGDWAPQGGEAPAAELQAAGNEVAAFQVAITGGASGVRGVAASLAGLQDGAGRTLPAGSVTLFREDTLNITRPSDGAGGTGAYPDPLVPAVDEVAGESRSAFPFDVAPGEARALWVDIHVPAGAGPDTYHGTLTLTGGAPARVAVTLTVYPFDLPATATLRSAFLMFANAACALELGSGCSGPDGQALLRRYLLLALDHRVSLANVAPVAAQPGDMSGYDAALSPFLSGQAPTRLPGAKLTSLMYPPGDDALQYAPFLTDTQSHGWADRTFVYAADEPGDGASTWGQEISTVGALRSAAPALPSLVTTTIQAASANGLLPTILTPVVNWMDDVSGAYAGDQRGAYDAFVAGGGQLWMYQSCMSHGCAFGGDPSETGWPSYMIDASAVRNRAMQWADFREQVSGELYYETVMAYEGDPWQSQYEFGGNGDGTLFYPGSPSRIGGRTEVPLASLRLKQIRAGMEDYEYLHLTAALGDPAFAMAECETVVPSVHAVNPDPGALRSARSALATRILELLPSPPAIPPAAESIPVPAPPRSPRPPPAGPAPGFNLSPAASAGSPLAGASTVRITYSGAGCATTAGPLSFPALLAALSLRRRARRPRAIRS